MIQIYSVDNTNYTSNGNIILFPDQCELEVSLNDAWELSLTHRLDDEGRWKFISEGAVIKAPSFNGDQLFRIYKCEKTDSDVTANARPIFLDAADDCFLLDVRPTAKNGQEALNIMCAQNSKYKGVSNIKTANTAYYVRKNLIEAINGDIEQSFIKRWGGEIIYDNYTIIINERAGGNYGVTFSYGKNITGISHTIDLDNVITRIVPQAYNGYAMDGQTPWVDSENINKYPVIYTVVIQFDDVKMAEDAQENDEENGVIICNNQQELNTALINKCREQFDVQKVDVPNITFDVDVLLLQYTEEYKKFQILETVSLGDDVLCKYQPLDIDITGRVISLTYDCIENRITNIIIGTFQYNYFDNVSSIVNRVDSVVRPDGSVVAEKIKGIIDGINSAIEIQSSAAQKVNGRDYKVEDSDEESELYGCMIWGTQGLQISTKRTADGRDWDWTTAITAKGIIADAVITGILSDRTGKNYWNLDTGEFRLSSEAFNVDGENVQDYIDGTIDEKIAQIRTLTLQLTNEFQGVPTDANGNNGNYAGCTTTAMAFVGTIDITESSQVKWQVNASSGVTGSWNISQKTYSVTNMTTDDGYVEITITYLNISTSKRFSISKVKAGKDGRIYYIESSASIIKQGADNAYTPRGVQLYSNYRDGNSTSVTPYAGRFKIEESTNGTEFTTIYTSPRDESGFYYVPSATNIKSMRVTLYAAGGTTQALDIQTIPVVRDVDNLTQEEVFDILTNGGQNQGIYLQDGRVYINAQYMQIGKIADKKGISYWDLSSGEMVIGGTIEQRADGNLTIRIRNNAMDFYAPKDSGNFIGWIGGLVNQKGNPQALCIAHDVGDVLVFSRKDQSSGGYIPQLEFDDSNAYFRSDVKNRYGTINKIFIGSDYIYTMKLAGNPNWYIHCDTNIGAFGIDIWASDGRMKKNIKESEVEALKVINQIQHRQFDWKDYEKHEDIGFIAQELEKINPNFVTKVPQYDEDGKTILDERYQISEKRLIPYLTKAIQELSEQVKQLQAEIVGIKQYNVMKKEEDIQQYDDEIKYYVPQEEEQIITMKGAD